MKTCTRCILPETFPGIRFDESGVCNHCTAFEVKRERLKAGKEKYAGKFQKIVEEHKSGGGAGEYDLLMAYSGGKDSTYTMLLLRRKYGLRILAYSLDNGFVSKVARRNITRVVDSLGVDHVMFKPRWDLLKKIFVYASNNEMYSKKSLERASTICTSCIGLVKSACLKTAIEKNIPLIGYGWSPGQAPVQSSILKNNPSFVLAAQKAVSEPIREAVGDEAEHYFLQDVHFEKPDMFPYNVHPLAWEHYDEAMIVEEIKKLGWEVPDDTDSNSSNCLLNAFANDVHVRKYRFHPYVWEIANIVREGAMDRAEGFEKIYGKQDRSLVDEARKQLDI